MSADLETIERLLTPMKPRANEGYETSERQYEASAPPSDSDEVAIGYPSSDWEHFLRSFSKLALWKLQVHKYDAHSRN